MNTYTNPGISKLDLKKFTICKFCKVKMNLDINTTHCKICEICVEGKIKFLQYKDLIIIVFGWINV